MRYRVNKNLFSPLNLLIGVLLVIAVVLGVLIYQQKMTDNVVSQDANNSENTSSPPTSVNTGRARPTPAGLTEEELVVYAVPGQNATTEERNAHYAAIVELSKRADLLEVGDCSKAEPLVFEVDLDSEFDISNSDDVEHTIVIDPENRITIPAGETVSAKASFQHGRGAYGYTCDQVGGIVGFIHVIE